MKKWNCSHAWIMKIFFCNKWIIKLRKCLFAIHELWKHEHFAILHELWKYLFAIHEFWKHESVCMQYMNYENICLQYMNSENMKVFVCNTWIIKEENIILQYIMNILFAKHELWRYEIFVCIHELWKYLLALH